MNRDFMSNFERSAQPKEEPVQPAQPEQPETIQNEDKFSDTDYIRNVCFIWPDGRQKFFSFSRLDAGEISADYDIINLTFGAETVELIGLRLQPLFKSFMEHKQKFVHCDDARYNELVEGEYVVNEIICS